MKTTKTANKPKSKAAKPVVADARPLVAELKGDAAPINPPDYDGALVAQIAKNATEKIFIGRRSTLFKGKQYDFVDIRIFYFDSNSNQYRPTSKGLTIALDKVGDAITGLAQASAVNGVKPSKEFPKRKTK